jgi:mannobiose 2-epimerase
MEYYIERLELELKRIMDFWMLHLISNENSLIYPECSIEGKPNSQSNLGSMYLSRVIYGSSAACSFLNTNKYKVLADLAFKMLYERFRNPAGGFYWARNPGNEIIHDSDNSNMGQAFVLYGLAEYARLTNNPIVESEMKKLQQFFIKTAGDTIHGGFFDGFNADWEQEKNFHKGLATHLHFMEAFVKQYQYKADKQLEVIITELIEIISDKFINTQKTECYHRLTPDWNLLPNFNWAGHNVEVGWLLTRAAESIKNENLYKHTCSIAKSLTEKVIEQAFDKSYGGIYNEIKDGQPTESNKFWWPQAEAALAFMNTYIITKDKIFLSYALRMVEYIENTFSDSINGEWYAVVTREGRPIESEPKVHFWKSIYHNVRYCIEMSNMIKSLLKR